MDALSPMHPAQRVVFMKAAQVGATEAGNNWLGYIIHQAPGPMLAVQPTVELAKRFSRQRIDPLIEESPALRERVKPARSRDAGNTMLSKEFPAGILIMTGANSAVGLRSMPARYLFLDEVDAYPPSADEEGDPVALAEARTLHLLVAVARCSWPRRRRSAGSRGSSASTRPPTSGATSSPCPHCGQTQWLKFERLRWEKGKPETAALYCEACDGRIAEHHKTAMLAGRRVAGDRRRRQIPARSASTSRRSTRRSGWFSLGADRARVGSGAGHRRGEAQLQEHRARRDLGRDRRGAGLAAALRAARELADRDRARMAGCS